MASGSPLSSFAALTRQSSQRRKPFVRIPPLWQLTAASRPPSPISDVTLRGVLEIDAAFTISAFVARDSNAKLFIEGLRKAGLPEQLSEVHEGSNGGTRLRCMSPLLA